MQAMAMALKCTVDQLVLCVVLEQRVLAASCRRPSGLASMGNWVHKMAQDFKANVVSTLPLMVMDASAAQATFCVYPQVRPSCAGGQRAGNGYMALPNCRLLHVMPAA